MVSPDKKKHPALRRKGTTTIVEAIVSEPIRLPDEKPNKSLRAKMKKNKAGKSSSVVSALVFKNDTQSSLPRRENDAQTAGVLPPISASVFTSTVYDPTFTTQLRNVIEYTFECLRDSVSDQTPATAYLERSIVEMKRLCNQAQQRLKTETLRRFKELIEETEAFARGEKTTLTSSDDYEGVLHYRHYVRIAWLTQFILGDLSASGF